MKNNFRNIIILLLIPVFGSLTPASSQEIPHPVANTGIYQFLDELANDQIISLSSVIKPFSRLFIA
ncbi:MAG: hypothetical protein GX876_01925, partial [Bacteroidales bacterium]|nr:hypothetical protein [Bacteroidales bacterium]